MSSVPKRLTVIHASRAAVDPVTQYYSRQAPEIELTNLLDDGVMRMLRNGDPWAGQRRLAGMIDVARTDYRADVILLTCSAVPVPILEQLRRGAGVPAIKIDEPMCEAAVADASRIGVVSSFPPTSATTRELLNEAAQRASRHVEIIEEQVPAALDALLQGDQPTHDKELLGAADRLAAKRPECIVLAQVSMAHLADRIAQSSGLPVFSSLASSLDAIRKLFSARRD
jgi:Asp/Glu/hydantoin racemase